MNKINRLFNSIIFLLFLFNLSCNKLEITPSESKFYGKIEVISGNNQSGIFGENLKDIIIIKASSNNLQRRYLIKFEMVQGNGEVILNSYTANSVMLDSIGIFKFNWRLGCNDNIQKVKFLLYVDSAKSYYENYDYYKIPSDSITITANGIKPTGWGRACGCENFDVFRTKIISFDKSTLYLINRGLYKSIDGGINWNKVKGIPNWEDIVDGQFNSSGWLYILTRNNGICFSKDLNQWEYINNGILDHRDPTTFLVEDSALFVSFYFDGPYKTTNNGKFWKKLLVGNGGGERYYFITRHPNGNLYLFDEWTNFWVSKDYGNLWQSIKLDYKYIPYEVYDLKIDKNGLIYIGSGDATISIISSTTYKGEARSYYQWNAFSQSIFNIQLLNDNVYYLVSGNPKPGIYTKINNWNFLDIGFSKKIFYFYIKSDNTFILLSNDGLYYYN